MIDFIVPTLLTPIFALLFAIAFPLSLYFWGFWQFLHRDDVRVIMRNVFSVFVVVIGCYSTLWLLIDPAPTLLQSSNFPASSFISRLYLRFALFFNYTGINIGNIFISNNTFFFQNFISIISTEVQSMLLGLLIVNSLFLGPLIQNILSWTISRSISRTTIFEQKRRTQLQNEPTSPKFTAPSHPIYPTSPILNVIAYELQHWTDAFSSVEIKPQSARHYFKSVIKSTLKEFQLSYQYCVSSFSVQSLQNVGELVEYESMCNFRSLFLSPIVEEMVYRSALYPLLLAQTNNISQTIVISAVLFASVHLHHFFRKQAEHGTAVALMQISLQWTYCFLFALFCGYLHTLPLIRTTSSHFQQIIEHNVPIQPMFSLSAAITCHMICNIYGLPDFIGVKHLHPRLSLVVIIAYFFGLFQFFLLLNYLPQL